MQGVPAGVALFQMMTGFAVAQAIYVAARLGVADRLAAGPRSADEIAKETGADAGAVYRLLRALASVGIFQEGPARVFALTPMAELLRTDAPGSLHAAALMLGDEQYRAWAELEHAVRTGRPAFDKVFGEPIFERLARDPQRGKVFDDAMKSIHGPETGAMLSVYDFSDFGTIVDIGGGNGSTLLEVLGAAPRARGVVFDLPAVVERTRSVIESAGMAGRCRVEGGDFFSSVPPIGAGDAYLLRHVVHDWDDERAVRILRRCRDAAKPGARVLIVESVIPPGNEPHPGKWLDLIMLAVPGGRERTAEEFGSLLKAAGLKLLRIVPTPSPVSVIEAAVE